MAKVYVKNGDLDKALKRFKRCMEKDAIMKDYKDHTSFKSKKVRRSNKNFISSKLKK